jgi:hypothetical protein
MLDVGTLQEVRASRVHLLENGGKSFKILGWTASCGRENCICFERKDLCDWHPPSPTTKGRQMRASLSLCTSHMPSHNVITDGNQLSRRLAHPSLAVETSIARVPSMLDYGSVLNIFSVNFYRETAASGIQQTIQMLPGK